MEGTHQTHMPTAAVERMFVIVERIRLPSCTKFNVCVKCVRSSLFLTCNISFAEILTPMAARVRAGMYEETIRIADVTANRPTCGNAEAHERYNYHSLMEPARYLRKGICSPHESCVRNDILGIISTR